MIESLVHRGPDDTGFFVDQQIGLASARLSIIDIEGGHQPIHNEDGTIQVVYNGEIYNFTKLRKDLESKGHRFYTRSDTEVIVHAYEQYGDGFIGLLNGMFAIALWDSKQKKLILARDRMGIKPLYFTMIDEQSLLFASEAKAFLPAPLKRAVNLQALYAVLNLSYIPGNQTLLEGVNKLLPATTLIHQNGSSRISTYWELPPLVSQVDEAAVVKQLDAHLGDAVRDQLVADVPVGCFLSGGLDTSVIAAYAARAMKQPLKTFCMGFGEETDEFRDARLIADRFGTDHYELMVESSEAMKLYPRMIWHIEAPKYNLYPWFVCELVRRHVKVCLSGNGGDEIFGGYYARYENALRISNLTRNAAAPLLRLSGAMLQSIPWNIRTGNRVRVLKSLDSNVEEYLILAGMMPDAFNQKLFHDAKYSPNPIRSLYAPFFKDRSLIDGLMNAELKTKLADDLLSVDDSMSMAHSLELRVPLLDNRLVDLMSPLSWKMKYAPGTHGKLLLRKTIQNLLPKESFRKPKWGFSVNVLSWYRGELGELLHQILPESDVIQRYFSQSMIKRLLEKKPKPQNRRYEVLLWQLLGFHFWHRMFIDSLTPNTPSFEIDALVN